MNLELGSLFLIGIGYLSLLFAIAYVTDRGLIPESLVSHPLVYTLSLGVFAGGWSFFGMTAVAARFGYGYLGYFVGVGAVFLFAPLLLMPLLRICRRLQLTSLADLLAFRYRGLLVGVIATLGMLAAALPLVAAQIKIVTDVAAILGENPLDPATRQQLGLVFACAIAVFAILFGARPISEQERHNGLVVTMAFESLVKLGCFLTIGAYAVFHVFGGVDGLSRWLSGNPQVLDALEESIGSSSAHMLTLTFFAAAIGLPHLFHMAFYENPRLKAVYRASWAFPLFLLLLSLPILPVLWAGLHLELTLPAEYFAVGIGLQTGTPSIAMLAFLGGLSASSSTIVVMTLALASMTMNNFVLPFYRLGGGHDLYRGLVVIRSVLTAVIILVAYLFSISLQEGGSLERLGFSAFIAAAQFFPGILALLYWPRANRNGLLGGLAAGFTVWAIMVMAPETEVLATALEKVLGFSLSGNPWAAAALLSITLNAATLITLSLLTVQGRDEREAAATCSLDNLSGGGHRQWVARSPADFVSALSNTIGVDGARREVERALQDLGFAASETRPYAMRRLRDRIEANLSRLMGAPVAMEIMHGSVEGAGSANVSASDDINFVESRLEDYQRYLTGFPAELDALRRFYRNTLQDLPIGVCGVNNNEKIVVWNHAVEKITGIAAESVLGSELAELPTPWESLLAGFAHSADSHLYNHRISASDRVQWISLHKTLHDPASQNHDARFILIEDVTETQRLQDELVHTERLASIGRLAAGVAHEIGNPVTGIDFLAQNLVAESAEAFTREGAREILSQTHRISNIVQALVGFAHSGGNHHRSPEAIEIAQCVDEAIYLLRLDRSAQPVEFVNSCATGVCVMANGQRLLQVFINLLNNARAAVGQDGRISIDCKPVEQTVVVSITDNGCGIPSADIDKVFEPFYTTKAPGEGTGLGLALVYSIIRDMQGSVSISSPVDSASGRGVCVQIALPAAADHDSPTRPD
jgi:PAS domain S-box-containing protein